MRFSFEESELINSFFEDIKEVPLKEMVVTELEQAKNNATEPELVEIVNSTIQKIKTLEPEAFNKVFSDLPIDTYTTY